MGSVRRSGFCKKQECESRYLLRKDKTKLPLKNKTGLYAIKRKKKVIYVGKSQGGLRKRLLAHFGGYDGQRIGHYLKRKKNRKNISYSWIKTRRPDRKEHNVIRCIARLQREHPQYNLKRGDKR